jgi:uncharacterized cofD-like protein
LNHADFDPPASPHQWRVERDVWLLREPSVTGSPRDLRVVALGGGTGLPIVLRGLRNLLFAPASVWSETTDPGCLTAIVTVADDGGSSGRLRREHRVLAPGDIRKCLLALADGNPLMARLFDFRFDGQGETAGHSLGNLIITALSRIGNGFDHAVEQSGKLLTIQGQVFPSTLDSVALQAEFVDGSTEIGESRIPRAGRPIRRVTLVPENARAVPHALGAIETADLIVIGPGSLYTSLIPNLLVREIADGIARSRARMVLVANLMTEPGETDGYTAADHVAALRRHAPRVQIHDVLLNTAPLPESLVEKYAAEGAVPVAPSLEALRAMGCRAVELPLVLPGSKLRHDPLKLARALIGLGPLSEET